MTVEEALGRIARAKENAIMAQNRLKAVWAIWLERDNVQGDADVEKLLEEAEERLELAMHDVKTLRATLRDGGHST